MILTPLNRIAWAVLLLFAGHVPSVAAQQVDKVTLRALVSPPRNTLLRSLSLSIGMGYSGLLGYTFLWEGQKYPADIARVQQQLRHAPSSLRALLYRQLGELYQAQGDRAQAQQAWKTSTSLYSRLLAQKPVNSRDGRFLAEYALALQQVGQTKEAEQQARTATRLVPKTWQAWYSAGQILMRKAQTMGAANPSGAANGPALSSSALAVWKEAQHDFDTAIRLAPRLPQPYEMRATFRSAFAHAANPAVVSGVAGVSDYEQAVALRSRDPYALACLAWLKYTDYGVHYFPGQSYDNFAVWKVLPLARKRLLLRMRRRIERLTASQDTPLRARAYTALAWLEYEFHDVAPAQAQTHLRTALQLQPELSEAGQLLMHTYGVEEQWEALARFCVEQAQRHSNVRCRLIAAYAYYKAKHPAQAEAQTRGAVRLAPDNLAANLFLTFLLLRSDDPEKWKAAEHCLDVADAQLMAVNYLTAEFKEAKAESAVLRAFCFAMLDRPEDARKEFMQVLDEDKENKEVRRALALLPQTINHQP